MEIRGHFHGIQGLYRGFVISAVGIFIYRGFYVGLYDSLKPIHPRLIHPRLHLEQYYPPDIPRKYNFARPLRIGQFLFLVLFYDGDSFEMLMKSAPFSQVLITFNCD